MNLERGDDASEFLSNSQCPKCSSLDECDKGGLVVEIPDMWKWNYDINSQILEQGYECLDCGAKFLLGHRYFFIKEIK